MTAHHKKRLKQRDRARNTNMTKHCNRQQKHSQIEHVHHAKQFEWHNKAASENFKKNFTIKLLLSILTIIQAFFLY